MGLPVQFIEVATPAELIKCLKADRCDAGSLGFDPTRADQVGGFTPSFMHTTDGCAPTRYREVVLTVRYVDL